MLSVQDKTLKPILEQFREVFSDELCTFNGPKVKLITDPSVTPKFISRDPYHM